MNPVLLNGIFDAESSRVRSVRLAGETANVFSEFGIIFAEPRIRVVVLCSVKFFGPLALGDYPRCASPDDRPEFPHDFRQSSRGEKLFGRGATLENADLNRQPPCC